jgi:predicted secreted Zn-dependent protease
MIALALCILATATRAEVVESLDEVSYTAYPQRGQTLRQALNAATPIREDGKIFHGHTKWNIRWTFNWRREADGRCRFTSNETRLDLVITMPELEGGGRTMQQRFADFHDALYDHELGHADLAREAAQAIDDAIRELPEMGNCTALEAAANRRAHAIVNASKRRQKQYDLDTEHGRRNGASAD